MGRKTPLHRKGKLTAESIYLNQTILERFRFKIRPKTLQMLKDSPQPDI